MFNCHSIGIFYSKQQEKYMAPKQAELALEEEGTIILNPGNNFEQAVEDLLGFERIWVLYWFHRNVNWKPKVLTPRGGNKKGVFATRSPYRPNPIGLSCVELIHLKGRKLTIGKNDLLNETPILDIKPYLNYSDAFPNSRQGWIDEASASILYSIEWSIKAKQQAEYIEHMSGVPFVSSIKLRLRDNPHPFPGHRIKHMNGNSYELALKTWRISFSIHDEVVKIESIFSGYDLETLNFQKPSKWDDVPLHVDFLKKFHDM